jgi:hypothetical protein
MKKHFKTSLSWALSLTLVFGLISAGNSSMLCIGADDSVKVESVCQPCCTSAETACTKDVISLASADHEACYDCTDVPLIVELFHQKNSTAILGSNVHYFNPPASMAAESVSNAACIAQITTKRSDYEPFVSRSIEYLSSTVIRR